MQVEKPSDIAAADRLLFPGVGSFGQAMSILKQRDLVKPLTDYIQVCVWGGGSAVWALLPGLCWRGSVSLHGEGGGPHRAGGGGGKRRRRERLVPWHLARMHSCAPHPYACTLTVLLPRNPTGGAPLPGHLPGPSAAV